MKVYTVDIDSYETDNPCATYNYSEDYPTFEEAQEALEEKFWKFEESHSLTERHTKFNWLTHEHEEDPNSEYYYTFEISSNNFDISGEWSSYSGEIIEKEIVNYLSDGRWYFVDKHGLPTENKIYLCSVIPQPWEIKKGIYSSEYTTYLEFYNGLFYEENGSNPNVYAWTELIQPASR